MPSDSVIAVEDVASEPGWADDCNHGTGDGVISDRERGIVRGREEGLQVSGGGAGGAAN